MARAGYDPHQALAFWKRMLRASTGKEPPEFLSDHPSDAHRVERIEAGCPKPAVPTDGTAELSLPGAGDHPDPHEAPRCLRVGDSAA
jgi:predicted Zn-dependent protease